MENWRKHINYRKRKNADDSVTFIITVAGADTEVSEDVYWAYSTSGRKIKYMEFDIKNARVLQDSDGKAIRDDNGNALMQPEREVSLEKLVSENVSFPSAELSPEDFVIAQLEISALHNALDSLDLSERELIDSLFFGDMTEREYSQKTGIAQKTINDRKRRILEKLKKIL